MECQTYPLLKKQIFCLQRRVTIWCCGASRRRCHSHFSGTGHQYFLLAEISWTKRSPLGMSLPPVYKRRPNNKANHIFCIHSHTHIDHTSTIDNRLNSRFDAIVVGRVQSAFFNPIHRLRHLSGRKSHSADDTARPLGMDSNSYNRLMALGRSRSQKSPDWCHSLARYCTSSTLQVLHSLSKLASHARASSLCSLTGSPAPLSFLRIATLLPAITA